MHTVASQTLRFWRSPQGQPPWARPALLAIAAFAAVLYSWRIADSGFAPFYSVAAKSMSVSWKAFFYGALDPGATITIDKLAGSFAPQALSARVFGYHAWSLTLPQVVEGVVAVLAVFRIGRRWLGPAAGLLAAGLFAVTPVAASMFGHPMEDGLLTMCLVLAADSFQRALVEDRPRSLVAAGVWVGVGFQAKMMQAWIVLPAFAVTYLVVARGSWRRRVGHLAVAGAVAVAVSLSWVAFYTATPAHDRPYVDGSTDNSAVAMVFGYNGLGRFGVSVPGSVRPMGGGARPPGPVRGPQRGDGGHGKLLTPRYASQTGWLYPLAVLGLILGLAGRGRADRTDALRGGYVLWGMWLLTFAAVFSEMRIPHMAYLSSLAPPVALLSAAGITQAWRAFRHRTGRWILPTLVVAEVTWTVYLSARFATFLPWLRWGVAIVAVLAVVGLFLRVRAVAVPVAVAAMVAVPGVWASSVLDARYGGSALDASAGPSGRGAFGFGGGRPAPGGSDLSGVPDGSTRPGGFTGGPFGAGTATLDTDQRKLYAYLDANRDGATYLAATDSWSTAAPYIMATGQDFLPMGGFSGSVPEPTMATARRLVAAGDLHYFLLAAPGAGGRGAGRRGGAASPTAAIAAWVRSTCVEVPSARWGVSAGPGGAQAPTARSGAARSGAARVGAARPGPVAVGFGRRAGASAPTPGGSVWGSGVSSLYWC